jgi:kinesin family member 18/19
LKKELAEKEHQLSVKPTEKTADSELSWLNVLSQETGENVQERINLQKALFELEETNKRNRMELQHLDDSIARHQVGDQFQTHSYSAELSAPKSTSNVLLPSTSLETSLSPFFVR